MDLSKLDWMFQGLFVTFVYEIIKYFYFKITNKKENVELKNNLKNNRKKYHGDIISLYLNTGVMVILIYIYSVALYKHMSEFDIMNVGKNIEFFGPFLILSLYPIFAIKNFVEEIKKNYH